MSRNITHKKRHQTCTVIFFFICLYAIGISIKLLPGWTLFYNDFETDYLFGKTFTIKKPYLEFHSPRSFQGDGYSAEIYKIEDEVTFYFTEHIELLKKNYPVQPDYRTHWQKTGWKKMPISTKEKQLFYDFILAEYFEKNDTSVEIQKIIQNALSNPQNYYSYFYFMHGNHIGDIDFMILAPVDKIFIMINHNT